MSVPVVTVGAAFVFFLIHVSGATLAEESLNSEDRRQLADELRQVELLREARLKDVQWFTTSETTVHRNGGSELEFGIRRICLGNGCSKIDSYRVEKPTTPAASNFSPESVQFAEGYNSTYSFSVSRVTAGQWRLPAENFYIAELDLKSGYPARKAAFFEMRHANPFGCSSNVPFSSLLSEDSPVNLKLVAAIWQGAPFRSDCLIQFDWMEGSPRKKVASGLIELSYRHAWAVSRYELDDPSDQVKLNCETIYQGEGDAVFPIEFNMKRSRGDDEWRIRERFSGISPSQADRAEFHLGYYHLPEPAPSGTIGWKSIALYAIFGGVLLAWLLQRIQRYSRQSDVAT